MDADVRVSRPDSLAQLVEFVEQGGAALVSGVPREETRGLMEKLIIPLIHFVLLGFLPLHRMRSGTDPRFAAACGQIVAVRRGIFREAFCKKLNYSVMLDWEGSVVKEFGYTKGVANIYVIDRSGRIVQHFEELGAGQIARNF